MDIHVGINIKQAGRSLQEIRPMRSIDPKPFLAYAPKPISQDLGMKPGLAWIPIEFLRIDPAYQREVLRRGARNIGRIASQFDWSLFGIVVVANVGNNLFAIVDGQHRTIAAAIRNIVEVPCIIIKADPELQARAFAAINGSVTAISQLSIFSAEVAAGEEKASALRVACSAAGVHICRHPVPSSEMKFGDTLAIGTLKKMMATYGARSLTLALKCLMKSSGTEIGMVKAPVIKAFCHVLDAEKSFSRSEENLLSAMKKFDLKAEFQKAEEDPKAKKGNVHSVLAVRLFEYLDEEIGE